MRLVFTVLVWLVAAAHLAFLIYLPSGGFLAIRWRRSIGVHAAVVLWGAGAAVLGFWCPLTALERALRTRAGMAPLAPSGFIDHYLSGHLWPPSATGYLQAAAFAAVLVSWVLYAVTAPGRSGVAAVG